MDTQFHSFFQRIFTSAYHMPGTAIYGGENPNFVKFAEKQGRQTLRRMENA